MRDVYVIGAYTTAFKKRPDKGFGDLAREAYLRALSDAGMKNGADIEAGWLGNALRAWVGTTGAGLKSVTCEQTWQSQRGE